MNKLRYGGGLIAARLVATLKFESHEGLLLPLQRSMRKLSL
jgi:hypothetical protein